jgi:hypothetical protein
MCSLKIPPSDHQKDRYVQETLPMEQRWHWQKRKMFSCLGCGLQAKKLGWFRHYWYPKSKWSPFDEISG